MYWLLPTELYLMHAIRGRLRVKVGTMKGNPGRATELERRLKVISVVRTAQANPLTGSLLITYDPQFLTALRSPEFCRAFLQESAAELSAVADLLDLRLTDDHVETLGHWVRTYWNGSQPEVMATLTHLLRDVGRVD